MPRHMAVPAHPRPRPRPRLTALTGTLVLALLATAALAGPVGGPLRHLPGVRACPPVDVDVVVSPDLLPAVTAIVGPLAGHDVHHRCLNPTVRAQEPQATVASADILPLARAPQIWIPDASAWGQQVLTWPLRPAGSLATTPVVIATSTEATHALGWAERSPTWKQVLRGSRPVIVPDYRTQSESLAALIALWQSLGQGTAADQDVVATVLAADRAELPDPAAAIADARSGSAMAPLFPATEQSVAYLNATSTVPQLSAVYPREGSPVLDYPIYRRTQPDPTVTAAVTTVVNRLRSAPAAETLRQAGFRRRADAPAPDSGSSGGTVVGTGIRHAQEVTVLAPPGPAQIDAMIERVEALAKPSRILTVIDVSRSMATRLDDGVSRIALAGAAARLGVNLLPDSGSVGLWVFAGKMSRHRDYRVLLPPRRLGERDEHGETQRNRMTRLSATVQTQLTGGGTALYDTTIAALEEMHRHYDRRAVNAIILLSDGGNFDRTGAGLDDVLDRIRTLNRSGRTVAIYTGGLGAQADYPALRAIARTSGGHTYRIDDALAGQQALLDGLRRSRGLGAPG